MRKLGLHQIGMRVVGARDVSARTKCAPLPGDDEGAQVIIAQVNVERAHELFAQSSRIGVQLLRAAEHDARDLRL